MLPSCLLGYRNFRHVSADNQTKVFFLDRIAFLFSRFISGDKYRGLKRKHKGAKEEYNDAKENNNYKTKHKVANENEKREKKNINARKKVQDNTKIQKTKKDAKGIQQWVLNSKRPKLVFLLAPTKPLPSYGLARPHPRYSAVERWLIVARHCHGEWGGGGGRGKNDRKKKTIAPFTYSKS